MLEYTCRKKCRKRYLRMELIVRTFRLQTSEIIRHYTYDSSSFSHFLSDNQLVKHIDIVRNIVCLSYLDIFFWFFFIFIDFLRIFILFIFFRLICIFCISCASLYRICVDFYLYGWRGITGLLTI
jgi:hypothetical protein